MGSSILSRLRDQLREQHVLYPFALGQRDHSRLELVAAPSAPLIALQSDFSRLPIGWPQNNLTHMRDEIAAEIRAVRPRHLLVSCPHAGALIDDAVSVKSLFSVLAEFSDDLHAAFLTATPEICLCDLQTTLVSLGRTAALGGAGDGALNQPISVPDPTVRLALWKSIFGQIEAQSYSGLSEFASEVLGLSLPDGPDMSIATWQLDRLIELNTLLVDQDLSNDLRQQLHEAALENPDTPLNDLLAPYQKIMRQDQKAKRVANRVQRRILAEEAPPPQAETLSAGAQKFMDANAQKQIDALLKTPFVPRNNGVVNFNEAILPKPVTTNPDIEDTGTLIVACIKNEAPYILEWIAYHQGIGVSDFLIYSNDCTDGSRELLDRLDALGIIHHENNDEWKGKSPQQAALNKAIKHKAYKSANWIIHIDIDEFINIRWGENGTLPELYAMMGDATNLAMTWRLFGHNGIRDFADQPVIQQFTGAVPAFCPKPHTAWGFKTLMRNVNAYDKLSCHRPNKLRDSAKNKVRWLNGSLMPMPDNVATQGWRSSIQNIGYDCVQLNHYALRSADSFLVKRQRGRALHVDRSIGLNYWVRMDWNLHRDMSIQRFLPRTAQNIAKLKSDLELAKWHESGVDWHRTKANELKTMPEFLDLYEQVIKINLTDVERAATAIAADMET